MDRIITAREANERFTEILREVDAGESFTLTSSGRPVARMVPADVANQKKSTADFHALLRSLPRFTHSWKREDLHD
jgi:prevent-host-death family protein